MAQWVLKVRRVNVAHREHRDARDRKVNAAPQEHRDVRDQMASAALVANADQRVCGQSKLLVLSIITLNKSFKMASESSLKAS